MSARRRWLRLHRAWRGIYRRIVFDDPARGFTKHKAVGAAIRVWPREQFRSPAVPRSTLCSS